MRPLVALLGLLWAAGNLLVAYVFVTTGLTDKIAAKGIDQQALLLSGGLLIALFALALVWRCLALAVHRGGG
jgi:uncharacterized membrane protein YhaH (DUF805 family)